MGLFRNRSQSPSLGIFLLILIFHLPGMATSAESDSKAVFAQWQASAFSHSTEGFCCWIFDSLGSIRLGISAPSPGSTLDYSLGKILDRQGDGWTIVLGEAGQGTINRWHEKWQKTPPGLETWIRNIFSTSVLDNPAYHDVNGHSRFKSRWQAPMLSLDPNATGSKYSNSENFRGRMTQRGRGRGEDAEIVTVEFLIPIRTGCIDDPWTPGTKLAVSSSRRSGRLNLDILSAVSILELPTEVFLPLWPMSQFFSSSEIFPGTLLPSNCISKDEEPQTE